ncbi:MAG: AAA family ATPase, partial [Fimbriimonadaceae bacterium]
MIRALQVTDLATLARVSVNWAPGFTALTGETGAGKSLLIDAIGLAMGGRADATMIRTGAHRATVVLEVEVGPALAETLRGMGFTPDEDTLILQREVTREGRSQARVNGQPCTAGQLKQIGRLLVDLHGQHDHQALLDPLGPVQFLDDWIGEPAHQAREAVAEAFAQWEAARDRLRHQQRNERERAQRVDLLRFQVQEIDDAGLTVGEYERIESLYRRL